MRRYKLGSQVALFLPVPTQASDDAIPCQEWAALKDAARKGQTFAYEFDGKELHVWRGTPDRGDRCQCRQRTWA